MSKDAGSVLISRRHALGVLSTISASAFPSQGATYSLKSNDAFQGLDIVAVNHCYLDKAVSDGRYAKNALVFQLNSFEIDREIFKSTQDLLLLELAEERLSDEYVDSLIIGPLDEMLNVAKRATEITEEILQNIQNNNQAGASTIADVLQVEADLIDKQLLQVRAELEKNQKQREVDAQRLKASAERIANERRVELNLGIRDVHTFVLPWEANVEFAAYEGAFVERGDVICRVKRS